MTQFDAGPGDWSDREWETPDRKRQPHAKRPKVVLPPWALLAAAVAVVILLCVGLILVVRAIRNKGDDATPTAVATTAPGTVAPARSTVELVIPADATATVVLPVGATEEPFVFTEIAPGATVVVLGTGNAGLNLRAQPTTQGKLVGSATEGQELTVIEGPETANQLEWWKVKTADGTEGWAAGKYLVLKTDR
jgi:hypothetical protein